MTFNHRVGCWCDACLMGAARKGAVAIASWSVLIGVLLMLVAMTGCGPVPRPQPPSQPLPNWTLTVRVVDAHTLDPIETARATSHTSDPERRVQVPLTGGVGVVRYPQGGYSVCGRALGYQQDGERCVPVTLTRDETAIVTLTKDPSVPPAPQLTPMGRWLRAEGVGRYRWRMATGFRLLDYLADGNTAAAEAFADWLQRTGFTGVRVLSTARHLFDLPAPAGRSALGSLWPLLATRGLHVELVALADTAGWSRAEADTHVRLIGEACAAQPACVIEIANEGAHPTQNRSITNDPAILQQLKALIPTLPARPVTATASNCCGQSDETEHYPGGDYITIHRDRGRDEWNNVRRVRELQAVSEISGRFVVDDEPIGAAEADEPGRRESNPSVFFVQGVACRIFEVGCTFHFSDGLQARVPGPVQQAAAEAFIAGTRIVPDDVVLTYKNATWHDSPVKSFDTSAAVRIYSGVSGARGITMVLGLTGDPRIVWQNGWRVTAELARRPGVVVYAVEQ